VRSFLDRAKDAVFARGQFARLFDDYLTHAQGQGPLAAETGLEFMRQAQASAVLQLALLPPGQFIAWTFNLTRPRLNVFLAGDNSEFQIAGRIFEDHVKTVAANRMYVETQRPRGEPIRSMVDFEGLDVPRVFEQYFLRSIQVRTRLFEFDSDDFLLVQGLPRIDPNWIDGLDRDSARRHVAQDLETIELRRYRFGCGCNPQKMLAVLRGMFRDKPAELFEGQAQVETTCPRCGRSWLITRIEFEASDSELGFT
jgi:hypothetical protein